MFCTHRVVSSEAAHGITVEQKSEYALYSPCCWQWSCPWYHRRTCCSARRCRWCRCPRSSSARCWYPGRGWSAPSTLSWSWPSMGTPITCYCTWTLVHLKRKKEKIALITSCTRKHSVVGMLSFFNGRKGIKAWLFTLETNWRSSQIEQTIVHSIRDEFQFIAAKEENSCWTHLLQSLCVQAGCPSVRTRMVF